MSIKFLLKHSVKSMEVYRLHLNIQKNCCIYFKKYSVVIKFDNFFSHLRFNGLPGFGIWILDSYSPYLERVPGSRELC